MYIKPYFPFRHGSLLPHIEPLRYNRPNINFEGLPTMAFPRTKPVALTLDNKAKPPVKKDTAPRKIKATVRINLWLVDDIDTIEVGTFYKYKKMHVKGIGRNQSDVTLIHEEFCITAKNECISKDKIGKLWTISKYPETELIVCSNETKPRPISKVQVFIEQVKPTDTIEQEVLGVGEEGNTAGKTGRPAGSRNKSTYLRAALGPMVCDSLVSTIKKLINEGDKATVLWAAGMIYVPPKEEIHTFFDIGPIKTMGNINDCMERVLIGATTGVLSHEDVRMITDVLERKRKVIFESRLQVMLDAMKMKNENLNIAEVMKFYE